MKAVQCVISCLVIVSCTLEAGTWQKDKKSSIASFSGGEHRFSEQKVCVAEGGWLGALALFLLALFSFGPTSVSITIEPERSLAAGESDADLELKAGVDAVSHSSLPWSEPESQTHMLGDALLRLTLFIWDSVLTIVCRDELQCKPTQTLQSYIYKQA
jgi:hypothetical protein